MYRDCRVTSSATDEDILRDLEINKLTPYNQSVILVKQRRIHEAHSQHMPRLTQQTLVLRTPEDCEIPPN